MKNAVLFSSSSQLDVIQVIEKGKWEHSATPSNISVGDTVFIIPNKVQRGIYKDSTQVAVAKVKSFKRGQGEEWASNLTEGSNLKYSFTVELAESKLVKFEDLKQVLNTGRFGPRGVRYLNLHGNN